MPVLPQFRGGSSVAFGPAPTPQVRPSNVGELISEAGRAVGGIEDALRQKDDEDGRVWAAKTQTELRAKYNQRLIEAQNSGEDLNGLVTKIEGELNTDLASVRKAAPNRYGAHHLDLAAPDFLADVKGAAFGAEARYRVTKRLADTQSIIELNRSQLFTNPGLFAKAYAETKAVIDGLSVPVEAKAQLAQQLQGLGASALQGMIENGNPYEAAKQLKSGAWNKYVDPDRLAALTNAAQGEIKRREAEAKANAAQARAEAAVDAASLAQSDLLSRQLTGKGVTDPEALKTIRAGLTPKQFEKYQVAAARADGVFKATGDMRAMPQSEMQAHLESLKPKGGEADFGDRQAAYTAAQQIASNIVTARKADPALAAREAFTSVRDKWSFYEAKPNKEHLKDAIKATLAAQEAMGIPANQRAPMPHGLAIAIAGGIKGAKPEAAAKELQAAAEQFGSYWPQAFKQMSKHLDGHARVAATIVDQKEAALLIEGSRQSVAELRKANGVKDGDDGIQRAAAEDPRVADLTVSLSQRAGGSATATQLSKSIEVLALTRMRVYGEDQATATEHAIQKIVSDRYDFARTGGQAFRVPKAAGDVSAIEAGARGVRQSIDLTDVDMPGVPAGAVVGPLRQSYIAAIRRNGYWVTNDDETGAILYSEYGVPVTKGGKPVAATWADLQRSDARVRGPQPLGADFVRERFQIGGQ